MANKYSLPFFALFVLLALNYSNTHAQIAEPDIILKEDTRTLKGMGLNNGLAFEAMINNFGFGIGGQYRRVAGESTEFYTSLRITSIRDVSEQTFTDFFFGQQIIPNKYNRVIGFPLVLGMRKRLFQDTVADNYRFNVSAGAGPAAAFSYPYFDDENNNGYRERFQNYFEETNDIFSGWNKGDWHLGLAGELKLGLDFGANFAKLTSLQFGYYFYFFPDGIQVMQPNQPVPVQNPGPNQSPYEVGPDGQLVMQPFFEKQTFFGTPQITLTFGKLW